MTFQRHSFFKAYLSNSDMPGIILGAYIDILFNFFLNTSLPRVSPVYM